MIFVTVGMERFPFDRLIRTMDLAVGKGKVREPVFIQRGRSSYVPMYAKHTDFMEFSQIVQVLEKARVVVSHAGVGSFLLCLRMGKVPILVPRKASFGEHLDDHQIDFVREIEALNKALVAYETDQVLRMIELYPWLVGKIGLKESFHADNTLAFCIKELMKSGERGGRPFHR